MTRSERCRLNSGWTHTACVQVLEDRRLLSADPLQVLIGAGAAKSVQYSDSNGAVVRVQLTGPGSASLNFEGTGLSQSSNARGIVLSGTGISLSTISASGTLTTSTLQISVSAKKTVNIGDITVNGALGTLSAPQCNETGNILTSKWVGRLMLAGASNGSISIGPAAGNAGLGLTASLGDVTNEIFASGVRVNTLSASQWINSHDVSNPAGEISAGQIGTISIAHDATVNMQAGSIGTLSVHGTLSSSTIYLTTPLTPLKMNMTRLTAGALDGVTLTSNGNLGTVSTKRMNDTSIQAGLAADVEPLNLPMTTSDFKNTSSITSVTITKSASASFSNSYVAAYTIGTAMLGSVSMVNTTPGTVFGVAAHKINVASLYALPGGKFVHVANPATTGVLNTALTAKGIAPADFEVSVV